VARRTGQQIDGQYAIGQSSQRLEMICYPPSDQHLAEGVRKALKDPSTHVLCPLTFWVNGAPTFVPWHFIDYPPLQSMQ
jgi:hypothetical protein